MSFTTTFTVVHTGYFAGFSLPLISSPSIQKMSNLPLLFILSITICLACASHKQKYFQGKKMVMWLLHRYSFVKCHFCVMFESLSMLQQWIPFFNMHSKTEARCAYSSLITLVWSISFSPFDRNLQNQRVTAAELHKTSKWKYLKADFIPI